MTLTEHDTRALGVALNEARLLGAELVVDRRLASLTFEVLTLPEEGPEPDDRRVRMVLTEVGRVAASLRPGAPGADGGEPIPVEPTELLEVVQGFGGGAIYGWEFFDVHEAQLAEWGARLSLDHVDPRGATTHSLCVFQEGVERQLDLCIWFDALELFTPSGERLSLSDFCEGGRRWWDALYAGDPRTAGHGIVPGGDAT